MKTRITMLAAALALLAGCLPWDRPEDWEYHEHPFTLHVRTVNHAADTIGVESCVLRLEGYSYSRPPGEGDMNYTFSREFPQALQVELAWPDSNWHSFPTSVLHFTGYQLEGGGDTTTLCRLSGLNEWTMSLALGQPEGRAVVSGDSVPVWCLDISDVPNRVTGPDTIEVELTVDMARVFKMHEGTLHVIEAAITLDQR